VKKRKKKSVKKVEAIMD